MKLVAVSGGLGFIGREVVAQLLARGDQVWVVDAGTYAADLSLLYDRAFRYRSCDIVDLPHLPDVDAVINLAAETHVDNSIRDSRAFVRSNVLGVQNLLELCRGKELPPTFIQISTDEVYGDCPEGESSEEAPLRPSSPYAASKAAADHLVQSYGRTYGLPYAIVRPSNCYGPHQYPEKLIPKAVRNFVQDRPMPLPASGSPLRSWLSVGDCARAILTVLDRGLGVFNVPGNTDASVTHILARIAELLEVTAEVTPTARPGLDSRYHVSGEPLRALGWVPTGDFWADLPALVEVEAANPRW